MIDKYAECQAIENSCKGKPAGEIISIRQHLVPLFNEMRSFAVERLQELSEKSTLAKAFSYFIGNFEGLTYFIHDAETPLENNQSERLLRSAVIGRKTWYGTHSRRGAATASIHLTLIESCKLIGLNPRIYYKVSVLDTTKALILAKPLDGRSGVFNLAAVLRVLSTNVSSAWITQCRPVSVHPCHHPRCLGSEGALPDQKLDEAPRVAVTTRHSSIYVARTNRL